MVDAADLGGTADTAATAAEDGAAGEEEVPEIEVRQRRGE